VNQYLNKIILGDCLEVMKELPDDISHVSITSPPYNYGTSKRYPNGRYGGNDDSMPLDEYRQFIFDTIDSLLRVTEHYVFFNIQRGNGNGTIVFEIFGKYKDYIKDVFVWAKTNPPNGGFVNGLVASGHEYIFCFSKSDNSKRSFSRYNFTSEDYVKNIIIKPVNSEHVEGHNAVFPMWLPMHFIRFFTFENDTVLDPFLGSGTTAIACIKTNRNFIGIEKEPKYVEIAQKRVDEELSQLKLAI